MKKQASIDKLLDVMATLRAPGGCPWDREQDHSSIRLHAIEEVYELIDAIEAKDDVEMAEELGDLLLQVVFHCQLAKERGVFDFERVAGQITQKLIRRHPHVFSATQIKNIDELWANWDKIKNAEKEGTVHERHSALDGIPRHLPALMRVEKLVKKARKAKLLPEPAKLVRKPTRTALAAQLFDLAQQAQQYGWSAEELLRGESSKRERQLRKAEKKAAAK